MARALIVVEERLGQGQAPCWAPLGAPLADVANRPLICHVVQGLREAGAEGVVVVADHASASGLRQALGREVGGSADVDWVELDGPVGVVDAIRAAGGVLAGERFLLHPPDAFVSGGREPMCCTLADGCADATHFFRARRATDPIALHPVGAEGATAPDRDDLVRLDGLCAFGPAIFDALQDLHPATRGTPTLLEVIRKLDSEAASVRSVVLGGWWQYAGAAQDLLDANRHILDALEPTPVEAQGTGCRIEGRVHAHPTARLSGAVIRGPVVIGPRARVLDAYVGPYTAVGSDVLVENAEIESSILLAGSSVRNVGARIEASILGRAASVTRDFKLPRGLRLLVGEGADVTLS